MLNLKKSSLILEEKKINIYQNYTKIDQTLKCSKHYRYVVFDRYSETENSYHQRSDQTTVLEELLL